MMADAIGNKIANGDDGSEIIDRILNAGRKLGYETEVYFVTGKGINLELKGKLIGEACGSETWAMGVRVIKDGRIGCSSTNSPSRWEDCLNSAIAGSKFSDMQEWGGMAKPSKPAVSSLNVFDKNIADCDIATAKELIERMLSAAEGKGAEIAGGSGSLSVGTTTVANTEGVSYSLEKTGCGVSMETIDGTSTGYEFDSSGFLKDLDPERVGREACEMAVFSKNGGDIATGKYDVILSPLSVCQLLSAVVIPSLSGRNVHSKRSYLEGKLGECVFDEKLSLYDNPFEGESARLYDAEGVPTKRIDFVKDGVVEAFAYDLRTAYRYGEKSTGSAVRAGAGGAPVIGTHNVCLDGKRENIFDEKAVFATGIVGAHTANGVTGDFSVELSNASWMNAGVKENPIKSAMLSGNIFDMLKNLSGISKESRDFGSGVIPYLRFSELSVIGR